MPDGFDPHKELARIDTLRELMQACRELAPRIVERLQEFIESEDPDIALQAMKLGLERGFGKARQHVTVSDAGSTSESRVSVYLPDNGRSITTGRIVDV